MRKTEDYTGKWRRENKRGNNWVKINQALITSQVFINIYQGKMGIILYVKSEKFLSVVQ